MPDTPHHFQDRVFSRQSSRKPGVMDITMFPFHELDKDAFRVEVRGSVSVLPRHRSRGNYVAGHVLAQYRIQMKESLGPRWTDLTAISKLPVELLLYIFEFLHPIDLYHLIRTTRSLRGILLNKSAAPGVWEKCFGANPDIPVYPKDVSAPKWASLLFGPAICDGCGIENTVVDFVYRRRNCYGSHCQTVGFLQPDTMPAEEVWRFVQRNLSDLHPDVESDVWRLVRCTYKRGECLYPRGNDYNVEPKYLKTEVLKMAEKINCFLKDISSGLPGAQEAYDQFIEKTTAAINETLQHARMCEAWASSIWKISKDTWKKSIPAYSEMSAKMLRKIGHDPRDINAMLNLVRMDMHGRWSYYSYPSVGSRKNIVWGDIRIYQNMVNSCKDNRLYTEVVRRITTRRQLLADFYMRIAKTHLKPSMVQCLPDLSLTSNWCVDLFWTYIHNDRFKCDAVAEVFGQAGEQTIIRLIDTVIADRKQYLLEVLANAHVASLQSLNGSSTELDHTSAMFICPYEPTSIMVGWADAGRHHHSEQTADEILSSVYPNLTVCCAMQYSHTAMHILKHLAGLLGIEDLYTFRPRDLDAMKQRFICKNCPFDWMAKAYGLFALDWRECIEHTLTAHHDKEFAYDREPNFDVVSYDLMRSLYFVEDIYPPPKETAWRCNHCSEHFCDPAKRAEAITHVKKMHGILRPAQGDDFFYHKTALSPRRRILFVGLDNNSNHRCLRCPEGKHLRMWHKENLFRHLRDAHNVARDDLVEGCDWKKCKAVKDEAWINKTLETLL